MVSALKMLDKWGSGKKLSGKTIGTEAKIDFCDACGNGRIVVNRVWDEEPRNSLETLPVA